MTTIRSVVLLLLACTAAVTLSASGRIGLYGVIEQVIFEPNQTSPERVQVWGAFAYADRNGSGPASPARRGYVYFRLPAGGSTSRDAVIAEWKDLKAVAGTGQAVAFGMWGHTGSLQTLDPSAKTPSSVFAMTSDRREPADLRVRPATEPPSAPSAYVPNAGVVKVGAEGSRADLVRSLKVALASK